MTAPSSARTRALTVLAVLTGMLLPMLPAQAAEQPGREPVILVHGWNGNAATWDTFASNLRAAGYRSDEIFVWTYNSWQSNERTAAQFGAFVDTVRAKTGASRVDVVTHSMGGLSTRWCLRFGTCAGKVDDWVSLGGPNHGTTIAGLCSFLMPACREMATGSAFLTKLNAGDETPGQDVTWTTVWSPCDGVIWPASSTVLDGATNLDAGCVLHTALPKHRPTFDRVVDLLSR